MPGEQSANPAAARARTIGLVLAAWLAFFTLWTVVSLSIHRASPNDWAPMFELDESLAIPWTLFTLAIALWHARVRRFTRNPIVVFAAHLPLLALVTLGDAITLRAGIDLFGSVVQVPFAATLVYYADFNVVRYIVVVAVTDVVLVRRTMITRERGAARTRGLLARARLDALEAQLQPHFLFNALGAVSELAFAAPALAARIVQQLAALVRYASSRRTDEVTLGEELEGIEPYLDIQRMRFADWLAIEYDVSPRAMDCLVPRLVLQPLIENAIRHGLAGRRAAGMIRIAADVADDMLVARIVDNGVGLRMQRDSGGHGIGLSNLRERLAILYEERGGADLQLSNSADGGTVAELTIPARRRDEVRAQSLDQHADGDALTNDAIDASTSERARPLVLGLSLIVIWMVSGVLWGQLSYTYLEMRGRLHGSSWFSIARNDITSALVWLLLTPLVFGIARAFPFERRRLWHRLPIHLTMITGVPLIHVYLYRRLTHAADALWSPLYEMMLVIDLLIVLLLAAIACRRQFLEWLRQREADALALQEELATARHRANALQAVSPILLDRLDHIARHVETDPRLTEALLVRLGDYLRDAREQTDVADLTPFVEASA